MRPDINVMKQDYLIIFLTGLFLSASFFCFGQNAMAKKIPGHYHYKYVVPYNIKQGSMVFSETGTMDFYENGHGLDSARQVYRLISNGTDTVYWTFNYVNQNKWKVDGGNVIYSGTPETFIFELLDLRVTNPALESWALEYADYILRRIRETIGDTEIFTIDKLNRKCLFLVPEGGSGRLEFFRD